MVLSVASFAGDKKVRDELVLCDEIRRRTLDACYGIPGYVGLPRAVKNKVYDRVKVRVMKEVLG